MERIKLECFFFLYLLQPYYSPHSLGYKLNSIENESPPIVIIDYDLSTKMPNNLQLLKSKDLLFSIIVKQSEDSTLSSGNL